MFSITLISDKYLPLQLSLPGHDLNPSIRMSPEDYRDTFWAMLRDAIDQVDEYKIPIPSTRNINHHQIKDWNTLHAYLT